MPGGRGRTAFVVAVSMNGPSVEGKEPQVDSLIPADGRLSTLSSRSARRIADARRGELFWTVQGIGVCVCPPRLVRSDSVHHFRRVSVMQHVAHSRQHVQLAVFELYVKSTCMFFGIDHFVRSTGEYHRRRMYFTVATLQGRSRRHHVRRVFSIRSDLYWS